MTGIVVCSGCTAETNINELFRLLSFLQQYMDYLDSGEEMGSNVTLRFWLKSENKAQHSGLNLGI